MKIIKTNFKDSFLFKPKIFNDKRGYLYESYRVKEILKIIGKKNNFVQENFTFSKKGVIRGLHFQKKKPQGKLVQVTNGRIYDVIVDLRINSKSFGNWQGFYLDGLTHEMLWVPPGFAHGFMVLSKEAFVNYKCTEYYHPAQQETLSWCDKSLSILWPKIKKLIISKKDMNGKKLTEVKL